MVTREKTITLRDLFEDEFPYADGLVFYTVEEKDYPFGTQTKVERVKNATGATHVAHEVAELGDYNNTSLLERSNFQVLRDEYGELDCTYVHFGGYGFATVLFSLSDTTGDVAYDVTEAFGLLNDYPVLDEEHWSELEWNESVKAIEEYLASDVKMDMLDMAENNSVKDKIDELPEEVMQRVCREADRLGVAHLQDYYGTIYQDTEKVAKFAFEYLELEQFA